MVVFGLTAESAYFPFRSVPFWVPERYTERNGTATSGRAEQGSKVELQFRWNQAGNVAMTVSACVLVILTVMGLQFPGVAKFH